MRSLLLLLGVRAGPLPRAVLPPAPALARRALGGPPALGGRGRLLSSSTAPPPPPPPPPPTSPRRSRENITERFTKSMMGSFKDTVVPTTKASKSERGGEKKKLDEEAQGFEQQAEGQGGRGKGKGKTRQEASSAQGPDLQGLNDLPEDERETELHKLNVHRLRALPTLNLRTYLKFTAEDPSVVESMALSDEKIARMTDEMRRNIRVSKDKLRILRAFVDMYGKDRDKITRKDIYTTAAKLAVNEALVENLLNQFDSLREVHLKLQEAQRRGEDLSYDLLIREGKDMLQSEVLTRYKKTLSRKGLVYSTRLKEKYKSVQQLARYERLPGRMRDRTAWRNAVDEHVQTVVAHHKETEFMSRNYNAWLRGG